MKLRVKLIGVILIMELDLLGIIVILDYFLIKINEI